MKRDWRYAIWYWATFFVFVLVVKLWEGLQ
jgi:hypothetical protein